ncbi:MAG: tRNA pseudouridine(38-40) synthase TruA [Candidatus Shikimatogenerans sp. Tduv]|uniref:tRNA pseudouridine synthase A n=1 Tax=Candidatus Shikimatogenerans sp. Tduv TaxID=3158567 RepID=A0AAU7QQS1_9FLAO
MRYFINIIYNGYNYYGFQKQKKKNTIEKILESSINKILKKNIKIIPCSRTDKLVNSFNFYMHFDIDIFLKNNFINVLNKILPIYIQIKDIFLVKNELHARYSVINRSYLYIINLNKNPFLYKKSYFLNRKINYKKMLLITEIIKNIKNFKYFTTKNIKNNNICNIYSIKWFIVNENFLFFYIKANRFLKFMIRSIIGVILKISTNKISFNKFFFLLKNKKYFIKYLLPSYALYLLDVKY